MTFGFQVSSFGFRVSSFGFRVSDFEFRVSDFEFRVNDHNEKTYHHIAINCLLPIAYCQLPFPGSTVFTILRCPAVFEPGFYR